MMPEIAAVQRLETKVDALILAVSKEEEALNRLADRVEAERRMTDQMIAFLQQAVDRVHSDLDAERQDRRKNNDSIEARLSKVGYALFTAFLALVGTGVAYGLFNAK